MGTEGIPGVVPGVQAPSWRDFERVGWQERVHAYHQFFAPVCRPAAGTVLDAVGAGPGTRLLDACCGPGYLAGAAAERGCGAVGIDIAAPMIRLATQLHPCARFQVGDAAQLPYAEAAYDMVVCNIGIHHVTDPAQVVAEFTRVMTSSGVLALTVWDDGRSQLGVVKDAVNAVSPAVPRGLPSAPQRPDYLSQEEVRELLHPAGLRLRHFIPITVDQRYADAQTLWDGWLATAIRTGPLLGAQTAAVRGAARAALDGLIAHNVDSSGAVSLQAVLMLIIADGRAR